MDTFVPNDVFLVGGAGIDSYPDIRVVDDDLTPEERTMGNSILICTGANACGKVRMYMCPGQKVAKHYDAECLPQAGAFVRSWKKI